MHASHPTSYACTRRDYHVYSRLPSALHSCRPEQRKSPQKMPNLSHLNHAFKNLEFWLPGLYADASKGSTKCKGGPGEGSTEWLGEALRSMHLAAGGSFRTCLCCLPAGVASACSQRRRSTAHGPCTYVQNPEHPWYNLDRCIAPPPPPRGCSPLALALMAHVLRHSFASPSLMNNRPTDLESPAQPRSNEPLPKTYRPTWGV
jgi:hypothetical protein